MKKIIIVIKGVSNQGKTTSINTLFSKLKEIGNVEEKHTDAKEVISIINYNKRKIGLCSIGDPKSSQEEWLKNLISKKCDIIITASRTRGSTTNLIYNLSESFGYDIIWTSNYISSVYDDEFHKKLNILFANSLVKLLNKLIGNGKNG